MFDVHGELVLLCGVFVAVEEISDDIFRGAGAMWAVQVVMSLDALEVFVEWYVACSGLCQHTCVIGVC